MFFELIATVVAGVGAAGLMMGLNKLSGGRLPRWIMPVAAGFAMIGFTIWSEYNWFARTANNLPEGLEVVAKVEQNGGLRVWTYAFPYVHRFAAVDHRSARINPKLPDQRIVNVVLFGRWKPVNQVPVLIDCAGQRRADLPVDAVFQADGTVANLTWRSLAADDPVLTASCKEG